MKQTAFFNIVQTLRAMSLLTILLLAAGCGEGGETVPGVTSYEFAAGATKQVDLGVVDYGDTAVVAVIPLNRDTADYVYDGSIEISYADTATTSRLVTTETRSEETDKSTYVDNKLQRDLAALYRQTEYEMLNSGINVINPSKAPSRATIGDERTFKNNMSDAYDSTTTVTATLQKIGTYSYIYVASDFIGTISDPDLNSLRDDFDSNIYPKIMQYYGGGAYSRYDHDSNAKVIILVDDLGEAVGNSLLMGLFWNVDYAETSLYPRSNEADMFYVNAHAFIDERFTLDQILSTLGHEFQHLVFFIESAYAGRSGSIETTWINEAFSGLSEYLTGYNGFSDDARITDYYFDVPEQISLLFWHIDNRAYDYGASNLFGLYLFDQFGPAILKAVNTTSGDPIVAIDEYSQANDSNSRTFEELLTDWALCNYITGLEINNRYSYGMDNTYYSGSLSPVNFTALPFVIQATASGSGDFSVNNTAVQYFTIIGDGSEVDISIQLNTKTGVIVYNPE